MRGIKKLLIVLIVSLLFAGLASADDPGMRDTVIIGTVYVDLGQSYVDIPILAVTDERVMFYSFPTTWTSQSERIEPSDVFYYHMLEYWETFDSVLVNENFIRMIGWLDIPFDLYLDTDSLRLHCWTIRFTIDNLAPPQVVTVDTTYDPINGSILFGLEGGIECLVPIVIPGAIYYGIPTEVTENHQILPSNIALLCSYPNPFNTTTTIEFTLPEEADVELSIYNILGQKTAVIFDGTKTAGRHSATWNAGEAPSGVYFARLEIGSDSKAIKILLLK